MIRAFNTDRNGHKFSEATRLAVWLKARKVPGYDAKLYRKDRCGAWMKWSDYGKTIPGGTGWEIDHKKPVARGGLDLLENLQALQWQNNRSKGDDWPAINFCVMQSI